jgi:hypothetical protein
LGLLVMMRSNLEGSGFQDREVSSLNGNSG